jgi:hypothetical protein
MKTKNICFQGGPEVSLWGLGRPSSSLSVFQQYGDYICGERMNLMVWLCFVKHFLREYNKLKCLENFLHVYVVSFYKKIAGHG